MQTIRKIAAVMLVTLGVLALLHLICLYCKRPLIRLVEIEGRSMEPTFASGERLVFVRHSWEIDSVVLADVAEDGLVVKRVVDVADGRVHLLGDNKEASADYWVSPAQMMGVFSFRFPLKVPCCKAN